MKNTKTRSGTAMRILLGMVLVTAVSKSNLIAADTKRPNIIFILTDDQRADAMGCMGNKVIQTPHLDKMASEGQLFKNAFCTTAICMTSRANFMLGQYERRHQIDSFRTPLSKEQFALSFPGQLKSAGYYTGMVGKWGMGGKLPKQHYDYFEGYSGQGQYFPKDKKDVAGEHQTAKLATQALTFLKQVPEDKPFCLQLYTKAAHCQDGAPDQFPADVKYDELYSQAQLPHDELVNDKYFQELPAFLQKSEARRRWHIRFEGDEMREKSVKDYYRLVNGIDDLIGSVRQQLKASGQDQNTVIIFSSDHGFYLGERGLAGKWFMHEESIRIPLIIYDPRLPSSQQGQISTEMALSIDISPTILELAGLEVDPAIQGQSLIPLIGQQTPAPWRNEFFYEHRFEHQRIPKSEGVRTDSWKYVRYTEIKPVHEELYNLEEDPREVVNLANNPNYQQQLKRLRNRWKELAKNLE